MKLMAFISGSPELQKTRIVLGGPELRHNAQNYLKAGAHLLVVGEGEETFYEVCSHFQINNEIPHDLAGTAVLDADGAVRFNDERPLLKNIDLLPFPARNMVDLTLYTKAWKNRHGFSSLSISTMRGCPYTCKWCSRAVYGGTYRRRSAALVAEEMLQIKNEYAPDNLWFVDDVFTINHKWLREFRNELQKRDLIIPYEIITRADRMNDEVIAILKETGCFRVWIGAESGSQSIIDAMDRRVDVKMVRDMIIKTKKAGMEAGTFIMLGYPGEKRSDIKETIRHLKVSSPTNYTITVAYPIAGTPLFLEVKDSLKNDLEWNKSTDRENDFDRGRSKRYYELAVKWVHNEVGFAKTNKFLEKVGFKSKSLAAQTLMLFN
jgi:radical SAM superfamily enzyme YgiQ (UPF0313 family)